MAQATISIAKCESYRQQTVSESLQRVLEPLGGIAAFVKPGDTVLIKINLLRSAAPDKAVTTHPALVEAVIEAVRTAGGTPVVGDSPGGPNTPRMIKKIAETTEIGAVCKRTGTELAIFDRDTARIASPEGKLYTGFAVGRIVRDANVVITLPKLKTHGFMKLTGAVKVLFGVIPGMEKAQFHLKVPDRMDFADMLLDIYLAVKPALSIMDAVVAMEGDGPSGGSPRHIGALIAGTDGVALDFIASKVIGFDPLDVYTNRAALYRGLLSGVSDIEIAGVPLADVAIKNFKAPTRDLADKIPSAFSTLLREVATSKPYLAVAEACTCCATCATSCPAEAITVDGSGPEFDYDACIRCYCCEELCPEVAIKRRNHWLVRPFIRNKSSG